MKLDEMMNLIGLSSQCFVIIYCLFSLAIIVENFMIPCLQNLAKKYNLSEQFSGYILAIASGIPEFTTNLVSATTDQANVNIGVGNVTGSGSFDFTVCFGIASFFTSVGGLNLNKNLYYRDSFIYLFTLSILTFFLKDNIINIYEAITLVLLFPIYLYISTTQLSNVDTDTLTNEQSPFQNNESKFDFNVSNELKSLRNQQNIGNESHMMRLNISVIDDGIGNHMSPFDFNSNYKRNIYLENSNHSMIDSSILIPENTTIINDGCENSSDLIIDEDQSTHEEDSIMLRKKQLNTFNTLINKNQHIVSTENSHSIYFFFKKFLSVYDNIKLLFVKIYSFFIPCPEKYSKFCFLIIFILTYIHTRIILSIISSLSTLINLSASFLGMTILSWGGNIGDTVNASVATKLNAVELLTTSILGSQVMNLQICLGLPWLISIIRNFYYNGYMILDFGDKNPLKYFFPLFLVVLASVFVMTLFNVNLNKKSGTCLIFIYTFYLVYEFKNNFQ